MPDQIGHLSEFERLFRNAGVGTGLTSKLLNVDQQDLSPLQQQFLGAGGTDANAAALIPNPQPQTPFTSVFQDVLDKQEVEDGGLFNAVANTFTIPQQTLFAIGKNIGEFISQEELGDETFIQELGKAVSGKGRLSFHDILASVGAEAIDFSLPEGIQIENAFVRIPVAIAAGIGSALTGVGAFASFTVGFGLEAALRGKGVVSSAADVALDPLNKLRLFQQSNKAAFAAKNAQNNSILKQVLEGDRRIFDLKGSAGFGKRVDAVSEWALTPIEFLQDHSIALINKGIGKPVTKIFDPVTGYINRRATGVFARIFSDTGDMVENIKSSGKSTDEAEKFGRTIKKAEQESQAIKNRGIAAIEDLLSKDTPTLRKFNVGEIERTQILPDQAGIIDLDTPRVDNVIRDSHSYLRRELQLKEDQLPPSETQARMREVGDEIDELNQNLLANYRQRAIVNTLAKGDPNNKQFIDERLELTVDIDRGHEQIRTVKRELVELEKVTPDVPAVSRGVSGAEVRVLRNLLDQVFSEDQLNRLEVFFERSGASRNMIDGSEEMISAELIARMANSSIGDSSNFILRLHRTADLNTGMKLITDAVFDNLNAGEKDQLLAIAAQTSRSIQPGDLRKWYGEQIYKAGIHATRKQDLGQAGWVARTVDGIRMFWRKMIALLTRKDFDNPEVYDWIKDFSNKIDHFSRIDKEGIVDLAKFVEVKDKPALYNMIIKTWAKMEEVGLLPEGSSYNFTRNGAIWMPLTKVDQQSANDLRKVIYERGIVSNTSISPDRSLGTISLQNVKEEIINQQEFIINNHILSQQEYKELTSVINKPKANLNQLLQPGTVANEHYTKLQRHMDLIPLEHFSQDEAVLRWHVVQSMANTTAKQVVDEAQQIGVQSTKEVAVLKASVVDHIDRVWLDQEENAKIAILLKEAEPNIKGREAIEAVEEVQVLLNKKILKVNEYAKIAFLMEKVYPELRGSIVPRLKVHLPKAGDVKDGGFLIARRGRRLDPLGRLHSPELARMAIAAKVFKLERVIDDKTFEVIGIEGVLKKQKGSGKVRLDNIFKSGDTFDDIFDTEVFKEIAEKGRGKTAPPVEGKTELPIREDLLKNRRTLAPEEIKRLREEEGYVLFTEQDLKLGRRVQQPPMIQSLVGLYMPKELHTVLKGTPINMPKQWRALGSAMESLVKGINDQDSKAFINAGADRVEQVTGVKVGEGLRDTSQRFIQGLNFDYLTFLFKSQALLGPGFHTRNLISGVVTNLMHDIKPLAHVDSFKELLASHRTGVVSQHLDEFMQKGMTGGGFTGELGVEAGGFLARDRPSFNPLSASRFVGYKMNFKLGGYIEDWLRYTVYKDARIAGRSIDDSADMVRALHFDYQDLSAVESKFLKRLLPFYTYFRKAIVRDSRMFMERTGNFFKMSHLIQSIEEQAEAPEESEQVAYWVNQRMGVPIRRNPDSGAVEYFLLSNWIPAVEMVEKVIGPVQGTGTHVLPTALTNFAESWLQQVNPLLKQPLEQITNWNFYFGKPIEEYQGQESDFFGLSVPVRAVPILRSIRFLNDLERGVTSLLQLPNSTNPNRPRPTASNAIFNVVAGGRIVPNDEPFKNLQRNVIFPTQDLKRRLSSEIRRTGINSDNSQNLLRLFTDAQNRQADIFSRVRRSSLAPLQKPPGEQDDPLQRLFTQRNPDNFLPP